MFTKRKRKRRLEKWEVDEIRHWYEKASQGNKPTIRQIARRYGVNQPSVVKSLGGWKGIQRGRPIPPPAPIESIPKPKIEGLGSPVKIEPHTTVVPKELENG